MKIESITITDMKHTFDGENRKVPRHYRANINGDPRKWDLGESPMSAAIEACRTVGEAMPKNLVLSYAQG